MLWGRKATTLALFLALFLLIFSPLLHSACSADGVACASPGECCSYYCNTTSSLCGPNPASCANDGAGCTIAGDCCSGYCDYGSYTCTASGSASSSGNPWNNIYLWVGFSVAIASAFIGLAYMAAKIFELQVLEAWVKVELHELGTSVIIAVFCISAIATVNAAAQFLAGETGATDISAAARDFVGGTLYSDGKLLYSKLSEAYFNLAKVVSYTYTVGISVEVSSHSYSQSPASGLSPLLMEVGQAMDGVSNFMLLASAQHAFLRFFNAAAIVMLPIGIFMRSFSLTRKIGGVVLAAVIASAVIYPAGFLLSKEVYSTYRQDLIRGIDSVRVAEASDPPAATTVCSPFVQRFVQSPLPFLGGEMGWWLSVCTVPCLATGPGFGGCMSTCYSYISTIFYIIKATFPVIMSIPLESYAESTLGMGNLMANYYEPLKDYALPAVAKFSVLSLVVFFIPLIIAMVMLRSLAILFGGEPQLYGITKLV